MSDGTDGFPWYRILSFDGGGARGVFQTTLLKHIAGVRDPLRKVSAVAGTSVGAILAVSLSLGVAPDELDNLFQDSVRRVFRRRRKALRYATIGPTYSQKDLREFVDVIARSRRFGDCMRPTFVPAVSLSDGSLRIFNSADSRDAELPAVDVILASSSAPTYLPPHEVAAIKVTFVDGGLACNNPAYEVALAAIRAGQRASDIKIMSIGTGRRPRTRDALYWRFRPPVAWAMPVLELSMDSSSDIADRYCRQIIGPEDYLRINPQYAEEIALDDAGRAARVLPALADTYFRENRAAIDAWYG